MGRFLHRESRALCDGRTTERGQHTLYTLLRGWDCHHHHPVWSSCVNGTYLFLLVHHSGFDCIELARHGWWVTGADISATGIEKARYDEEGRMEDRPDFY